MICEDMFVPKYNIGKFLEFVYTYEFDSLAPQKIYHKRFVKFFIFTLNVLLFFFFFLVKNFSI
jgi:hypothetical protein